MKLADWFRDWNDINVVTAKTVLVSIMQLCAFGCIQLMWCVAMIVQLRHWQPGQDVDFHTEFLYLELGALLALSGINLGSRIVNRTTDVDYQLAKSAGRSAVNVSGDNPSVTATIGDEPLQPHTGEMPSFTRLTRRQSAAVAVATDAPRAEPVASQAASHARGNAIAESATTLAGPRSIVTDHDRGII